MSNKFFWVTGILALCGILVSCSPLQTPVAIATATVIPSTATPTSLPVTPSAIPVASQTPIPLNPVSDPTILSILETRIEIDTELTQNILGDLAQTLDIPQNRIQLVDVEEAIWHDDTLGCDPPDIEDRRVGMAMDLEPVEGLRYRLLVGNTLYEYHTAGTSEFVHCEKQSIIRDEILLAVDPLAAEILVVVQNLVAQELDLSSRRVQLVTIQPVTWNNTSLGCPLEDQTYTERDIPGYHIVVAAGNEQYIYHSDSNTAYACPPEQSIIPIE